MWEIEDDYDRHKKIKDFMDTPEPIKNSYEHSNLGDSHGDEYSHELEEPSGGSDVYIVIGTSGIFFFLIVAAFLVLGIVSKN